MCRHHARADQRSARGDRRIERHVRVEALVPERLPELGRRDVVADHDRDDRSDDLPAAWQRGRLDDPVSELAKARVEVARVVQHSREELRALGRTADPDRLERGPDGRRHRSGAEEKRAGRDAQVVDHLGRARDEAAAAREGLREGPHPQIHVLVDPEELAGPGAARPQHPDPQQQCHHDFQDGQCAADLSRRHPERQRCHDHLHCIERPDRVPVRGQQHHLDGLRAGQGEE